MGGIMGRPASDGNTSARFHYTVLKKYILEDDNVTFRSNLFFFFLVAKRRRKGQPLLGLSSVVSFFSTSLPALDSYISL